MAKLVFDTETTGWHHSKKPDNHPDQPRLVQLGIELCSDQGEPMSAVSLLVNPQMPIPEKAMEAHGITDEMVQTFGVRESTAAELFVAMAARADTWVMHNSRYDLGVMRCVFARAGIRMVMPINGAYCTMEAAKRHLPGPLSNLSYCMLKIFGESHDNAHNALADTIACRRLYFHFVSRMRT